MAILHFLKTSPEARKIFGKRELEIIEKQLLGISLTQSEKNRLSRDIRQKLEFVKELSIYIKEFKLKKGAIIKQIINETKEIILQDVLYKNIKNIFLFGSTSENKRHMSSDIDIGIEFYTISLKDATEFRKRILGKVNSLVDIQVYNILTNKIKKEIEKKKRNKGLILYECKNKR